MGDLKIFRERIGYPQEDNNITEKFGLEGGLDVELTDAIGAPGALIYCNNYEASTSGGYQSKAGCEPVDGSPQVSAYVYQAVRVTITTPASSPATGQIVGTGGAGANTVYYLGNETIGGVQYMIFTCLLQALMTQFFDKTIATDGRLRGTIANGTGLFNGAVQFGTSAAAATFIADNSKSYYYITLARSTVRALVLAVSGVTGGSGAALGVFDWNGKLWAFRNNAGGTAAALYVATGAGWAAVNLGSILYYNTGSVQINVGDVLTGATSAATTTVLSVVNMFGTVGGGDATGYVSTRTVAGVFVAGEILRVGGVAVAKIPASGNIRVNNTLPPGGSYRFRRWNFGGVANNVRMYGVNGVGTAFELATPILTVPVSVCFTPLITGTGLTAATFNSTPTTDTPNFIGAAHDQLFLGYPGGNLLHSGYQTPTNWTAVQGADDRALGEDITNIVEDINSAVLVTTRTRLRMLYGDVNENFQLRDIATTFGAFPNTASRIGGAVFLTDEGVMFWDQSAQFGNFAGVAISQGVKSLLRALIAAGQGVVEASINRDRSQYRLYFDGGVCLSFCINGTEPKGIGMCNYGINVHNVWSAASTIPVSDAAVPPPSPEKIYFCGDDGFVYLDDTGGTFGAIGSPITTGLQTQFYYGQDNQQNIKYYRSVKTDITGADAFTNLQVGAEYDDGYGYRTPEVFETITRALTGSVFDQSSLYGTGFYGGAGKNIIRKKLNNSGIAISLLYSSTSAIAFPHTLQAAAITKAVRARSIWR